MTEKKKVIRLRDWVPAEKEELDRIFKLVTPSIEDLSEFSRGDSEVKSKKFVWNGLEFWEADQNGKGKVWTTNIKDPKIINHASGRIRGNLMFKDGGGNPSGRPKGVSNRVSAKAACEKLGANPMEMNVAIMMKDKATLRKYGIHNLKDITVAMQLRASMYVGDKLVPNLKPAELGADGEAAISSDLVANEERKQIQAYIPVVQDSPVLAISKEEYEQVNSVGVDQYMKDHENEMEPYDTGNSEETMVWSAKSE